jgi:hypothetical protein
MVFPADQGCSFIADQKLGHYLHIPPRSVFVAQGIATLIGALVQAGVTIRILQRVRGVCSTDAPAGYTCPHGRVTYSSSLIWGETNSLSSLSFALLCY